jgi:hypothetical protein
MESTEPVDRGNIFTSPEDVAGYLVAAGLPEDVADRTAHVVMEHRGAMVEALGAVSWMNSRTGRVIRATELEFFKSLISGSLATAVASYVAATAANLPTAAPLAAALAGLLGAAYTINFNLSHKGTTLAPLQISILAAIKATSQADGATLAEISRRLGFGGLAEDELMVELKKLSAVTLDNGTVVALAFQDGAGRWKTDC